MGYKVVLRLTIGLQTWTSTSDSPQPPHRKINRRNQHNHYDKRIAVAGVDFDLDGISLDAMDGGGINPGKHGGVMGETRRE